jgi:DNA-binding winged helix-turn-helix (wHTH) protein
MPDRQFVFAPFRLDLVNEQLREREEFAPPPKLFAVPRYLAEHARRLVTHEELCAAVWPTTVVSEGAAVVDTFLARLGTGDWGLGVR